MTKSLRLRIQRLRPQREGKTHLLQDRSAASRPLPIVLHGGVEVVLHTGVEVAGQLKATTLQGLQDRLTAADGSPPKVNADWLWALGETLGRLLFEEGDLPEADEMWIETDDPFVAGLPWILTRTLNADAPAVQGTPVGICLGKPNGRSGLPPCPRMLIAAPDPITRTLHPTESREHIEELRKGLASHTEPPTRSSVEIIEDIPMTSEALTRALKREQPDILYFFGHGVLTDQNGRIDHQLRLLMQRDAGHASEGAVPWPVTKLAEFLQADASVRDRLALVYLNCCWGGAPGLFGGAMQIGRLVPALIANRTSALIPAARTQAARIFQLILRHGLAPHEAVALVARDARGIEGNFAAIRADADEPWWMTPTVFASYETWTPSAPTRRSSEIFTLRETIALDRASHWQTVRDCLKETGDKSVIVVAWDGAEQDGLHALADRIYDELRNELQPVKVIRLTANAIAWPAQFRNINEIDVYRLMRECVLASVNADEGAAGCGARAAERMLGPRGGIAVLEFDAVPLGTTSKQAMTLMKGCIMALNDTFVAPLRNTGAAGRIRVLALMRFTSDPDVPVLKENIVTSTQTSVHVERLPFLNRVHSADVSAFLVRLRQRRESLYQYRQQIAESIINKTTGQYEKTRAALVHCESFTPEDEE